MKLGFIWFQTGVLRFSKHQEPPQNSRQQNGHMKQVPHWRHTHFRCQQDLTVMEIWDLCTPGVWKYYLDQGWWTYNICAQNGTWEDSLARGIHCCPNFFYLFCLISITVLWRISDCIETVYKLLLLSNNTVSETYLNKSRVVQSKDWIFIIGVPAWWWEGKYITLDKTFYNPLFRQDLLLAQIISKFSSLSHSLRRLLFEI